MTEEELQTIWAELRFDHRKLRTGDGDVVTINDPGVLNRNQGPDFLDASIYIGGVLFHGDVEIHLTSADWYKHGHESDENYNGVILHVVGKRTAHHIRCQDGLVLPEIEIGNLIDHDALPWVVKTIAGPAHLPCRSFLPTINDDEKQDWIRENGRKRIRKRAQQLYERLEELSGDWGQVLWEELARTIGGKINGDTFHSVARRIPVKIIRLNANEQWKLEAILYGMFGFLHGEHCTDVYFLMLKTQWEFIRKKYKLQSTPLLLRNHRMRPASQPQIRISQLAAMMTSFVQPGELLSAHKQRKFFSTDITASSYWHSHSNFGQFNPPKNKKLGINLKRNILINVLIPIGVLYEEFHGNSIKAEEMLAHLEDLPTEENRWTRRFEDAGLESRNALESQGLLNLQKEFCGQGKCLTCALGKKILQQKY